MERTGLSLSRAIAEFSIIVLGVLVALAADAWNDRRLDRAEEREILADLAAEFTANREAAVAVERSKSRQSRRFDWLRQASADEVRALPGDSVPRYHRCLIADWVYDPAFGALTATINSGKLGLVEDAQLRARLGGWLGTIGDLSQAHAAMSDASSLVLREMARHGGPYQHFPDDSTRAFEPLPVIDSDILAEMRLDEELMGVARIKHLAAAGYANRLNRLIAQADTILVEIGDALDDT